MQQDAHEFLNYLLNTVADILQEEKKQEKQNGRLKNNGAAVAAAEAEAENKAEPTWVHDIFQGTLTNETRCLNCETVLFLFPFFSQSLSLRRPPATPVLPLLNMHERKAKEWRISLTQRC